MIRALALLLLLTPPAQAEVAEEAARAAADLSTAVAALEEATGAQDRIAALTRTIKAYEAGLAALREALRQASFRDAQLTRAFQDKRDRVAQLVGVLGQIDPDPGPLLLLHPSGPLGTVRSGMMLADVTPALQAEAETLRTELAELAELRSLQIAAGQTLATGLQAAQAARTALSQAMSDRTPLPRRFTEDPEVLRGLLESADTLDAFAAGLALDDRAETGFADAKGQLPLPVLGRIVLMPDETDAAGITRPGLTLATRPLAIVTAPWAATIRYTGPLLDYGNVMILEPGGGYLIILAGLDTIYGEVGQVIAAGTPIGLMGTTAPGGADILAEVAEEGGTAGSETLYLELRLGAKTVNPLEWFAAIGE
ncbi:MAG: murein hydrolase activator EnvC family protein [Paracoccaceae bacterium]